jgi:hypothetical protein
LRPNLSFGHSAVRGGWVSHDADKTHLHVDEVVEVARTTYSVFEQYLQQHKSLVSHSPANWATLEPAVREFAEADSKTGKDAWSVKHVKEPSEQQGEMLEKVSLRGPVTRAARARLASRSQGMPVTPKVSSEVAPPQLVDTAQRFLDFWLHQSVAAASGLYINWEAMREQFRDAPSFSSILNSSGKLETWCQKLMMAALVVDHAAVENVGHGDPRQSRYGELPRGPLRDGPLRTGSIDGVRITSDNLSPVLINDQLAFVMALSTDYTPRDVIGIVWQGSPWRVIRMISFAECLTLLPSQRTTRD